MNKQCVNCPGATDHTTAECPVMVEASAPIDPIHSAMMLGMTPEPCEPVIEITRQAVTKLLDVVEFGDQLERVEKDRLVAFVKEILAQDQPELWATYSPGPGEIHPCLTKEHAEREAKATLEAVEKMKADHIARGKSVEFWPKIVVDVIPSPFTPLEHFELLAEETIQHRDELVEHVGELKNKLKDTPEPAWRALIRLAMNLLSLRNHVPGSDIDLCVKALDDLLEGKHSPAPEPSEAWREVAEIAQAEAHAVAMPLEISRDLLGKIVDEVFDGAIEDASVIEDVYRVIAREHATMAEPSNMAGMHTLDAICDLFMIGKDARTHICVMTNIENTHKFAKLLHAIESEFFMVPGEPDEDYPDEEPSDDCLLNCWGSTQEQYVEQFRAALPSVAKQHLIAAARDVLAERHRQVNVEGFHGFRDSHYLSYELSKAARAYIEVSWHALSNGPPCKQPESWPWRDGFKWSDGRTMLVKAGALILAEIERLDRAEQSKQKERQP